MYKKMRLFSLVLGLISVLFLSACTNSVEFTINFDSNGGSEVSSIKTDGTSSITLPNDPIKDGYTFGGWYWDNETFSNPFTANSLLDSPLSSNMTVYAKWTSSEEEDLGIVSATGFEIDGTNMYIEVPNITTTYSFINLITVSPSATWDLYNDITATNKIASKTINLSIGDNKVYILVSKNDEIMLYTVTVRRLPIYEVSFNTGGGLLVESQSIQEGDFLEEPVTTKQGYTFIRWEDINNNIITFPIKIENDMLIKAKWQVNQNTLSFEGNSGVGEMSSVLVETNETISLPKNTFTREGYTFIGWSTSIDGSVDYVDEASYTMGVLTSYTLYAKWAQMYEYFTIDNMTYVYYGTYPQTVVDDSSLISSLNSLTSTNANGYYEFEGEEYAKVVAHPFETGYQFINGSTIQSGQTYYFKVEPIKWRVLEEDDGTYTLLSEFIIDKQVFYTSNNTRTIGGQTIYANNYEHSTIREWLNNAFYNKAFSTPEKSSIKATLEVTVNVASITLTGRTEVEVGKTIMLGVTALPEGASNEATFTTSDAAIATVDANGKVTGVAEGMVTITATSKENTAIKDDHVITVKAASTEEPEDPVIMPTSIILSYTNDTVEVGWKLQFSATVYPEGASQNVTWHSRKEEVATVDSKGYVTGVAEGTTYIYAVSVADPTIQSDYQKVTVTPDSSAGIVYPDMQGYVIKIMNASSALTTESSTNPYFSNNTMDKVYLLSYQEAISSTYGFSTSTGSSSTRTAVTTDYARAVGAYMSTSTSSYGNGYWWLRSPHRTIHNYAHYVHYDGNISNIYVSYSNYGARPAIKID